MEQNNIDTEFGQKLRNREITPSADSWEKLNSRFEKDNKRSISYKWMLGIAASLVAGLLILGQIYHFSGNEESPTLVETPREIPQNKKRPIQVPNATLVTEEYEDPVSRKESPITPVKITPTRRPQVIVQLDKDTITKETSLAQEKVEEKKQDLPEGLEQAIAAVTSKLAENQQLETAEVDSLLLLAASQISGERTRHFAGESIDAESLLWDVEMEMEQSFREKVFDLMKEGYLKARTAVANRNY